MLNKKPKVFITRRLPKKVETRMMELFDTTLNESDTLLNESELIEVFSKYEIIVPSIADYDGNTSTSNSKSEGCYHISTSATDSEGPGTGNIIFGPIFKDKAP